MVKLHLGCGQKYWPEWLNVDSHPSARADLYCDITQMDFRPNTIEAIEAIHVFEHFHPIRAPHILSHWWSLLVPGGTIALEMPSLSKIVANFQRFREQDRDENPTSPTWPEKLTRWGLFGDPYVSAENELMGHKWAYYPSEIIAMLNVLGAREAREEDPKFHKPLRDMRIVGVK